MGRSRGRSAAGAQGDQVEAAASMRAGSYPRQGRRGIGEGGRRRRDAAVAGFQEHEARPEDADVCHARLRLDFFVGRRGYHSHAASAIRPHT